jgi:hypothetical protein
MPKKFRDERGQAAIFMALFMSTMIMLFAFTTNIGMLVHAKINLQNAADAAAYAGAATQARQLTAAAYLNWEMRRALKEFLFYTQVRSMYSSMPCFPLNHNGDRIGLCPPRAPQERHDFAFVDPRPGEPNEATGSGLNYVPSTCIIFDPNNNYCQKAGVPGIPEFPAGGGWGVADPIVAAVRSATNQIINKKLEDCEGRTDINRQFIIAWLFNFYPVRDPTALLSTGKDSDDPFPFSNGLERLGILPRSAMLRARIDNIEETLNLNLANEGVGSATITDQTMGALRGFAAGNKNLDYFERPIQAFLSAKNNLPAVGEENGNFSEVELTELLPNRPANVDNNPNLQNPPILAKFNDIMGKASFANSLFKQIAGQDRGNCYQFRELRTVAGFPFGVTKDPNVLTYYAVRLQTKARLLFSPFGGNGVVTLSAYSAAKPFGSRIGKNLNPEKTDDGALRMMMGRALLGRQFGEGGGGSIVDSEGGMVTGFSPRIPNVLVADGDTTSEEAGFSTNEHLGYLRGAVAFLQRLDYGPRLAGAYAPWEIGYYTPPANFGVDVIGKFEDNPIYQGKFFALVAPLYPVNGSVNDVSFIKQRVMQYLEGDLLASETLSSSQFRAFLDAMMDDSRVAALTDYIQATKETVFHYIPDPLLTDEPNLAAYARSVGAKWTVAGMSDPYKRQLTSWNTQKTASDGPEQGIEPNSELGLDMGRSGYSVKFMSFTSLRAGGRTTNDPGMIGMQWTNPLQRLDAGSAATRIFDDINKIKH